MRLLDSDILIDIQRGHAPAVAWFSTLTELPGVSSLVVMELIQDAHTKVQVEQVLKLIKPLPVVFATEADQQRALEDYKTLHLSHRLGLLDALIAATAIGLGATLCKFYLKHYKAVSGLVTEQPYSKTP